ncbi:MAG: aldehyde dehydrogenase family protein [Planctomycetota bacterium]|nr:aldehyde dehydrogenase family protein [Planctomycetota bacterium]
MQSDARLMIESDRPPAGTTTVTAPYDGSVIAELPVGDATHVDEALAVAAATHADRDGWLPLHERIAILKRTAALMEAEQEALAVQAAREGGKPLIDSRVEVARAIDGIHLCIEVIRTEQGDVIPMGGTPAGAGRIALTQREPIGPVVAVSAFNHPLNLIVHQVAAAVAAGCPVIVKPAEDTPLSCIRLAELFREAGLPPAWCQVLLTDSHASAEALVTDPRVAFFTFIGSARVGWMLRSKLAPGTRCALEHGGVAPLFLAADADLDAAVPAAAKGGFYHAGQVCVSVQRVYAHREIARTFAERLADAARAQVIGDPTSAETEVGPLIRPREVTRVHEWVEDAVEAGAERLAGGDPLSETCYPCTVLFDPPADAKVSTEEVFGPVVCVYPYDDLDAAIEQANALPVAFQAAVFTQDMDTALRVYRRVAASAVMVGDHTAFRVDGMPFAGLRESGLGIGGIGYTIADMQVEKMLVLKSKEL